MQRLARFAAVALGTALLGLLVTAFAFRWLAVAPSGEALVGLAGVLLAGNFLVLRQGLRWVGQPAVDRPAAAPAHAASTPLAIPAVH